VEFAVSDCEAYVKMVHNDPSLQGICVCLVRVQHHAALESLHAPVHRFERVGNFDLLCILSVALLQTFQLVMVVSWILEHTEVRLLIP
jgi:hypothetical protein